MRHSKAGPKAKEESQLTSSELEPRASNRREPRSDTVISIAVCGIAHTGRLFFELCATRNISRSGCCLHLRTRPQSDSALALRIVPRGGIIGEGLVQLLFQVAWLKPEGDGWSVGAFAIDEGDLRRVAFPSTSS